MRISAPLRIARWLPSLLAALALSVTAVTALAQEQQPQQAQQPQVQQPQVQQSQPSEQAQPKPPEPQVFQDWRVQCENAGGAQSKAGDGQSKHCYMFQSLLLRESGQRLLLFAITTETKDGMPMALVRVPLGVLLPPGLNLQVDDGASKRLPYARCHQQGCDVQFELDKTLMSAMKAGLKAEVTFVDPRRQPVTVPLSLKGFTAALNALAKH
jgi:invasion protein IalB